jgi:hypothetical protein
MRHGIVDVTQKLNGQSLGYITPPGPHSVSFNSDGRWAEHDKYPTLISLEAAEKLGLITRKMRKVVYLDKDLDSYEIDAVPCESKEEFDEYFKGFDYVFLGFVGEKSNDEAEYAGLV